MIPRLTLHCSCLMGYVVSYALLAVHARLADPAAVAAYLLLSGVNVLHLLAAARKLLRRRRPATGPAPG